VKDLLTGRQPLHRSDADRVDGPRRQARKQTRMVDQELFEAAKLIDRILCRGLRSAGLGDPIVCTSSLFACLLLGRRPRSASRLPR
jgi:hypothetical protein